MRLSPIVCATFVALAALALTSDGAFASETPIPGVDIIVRCPRCHPPVNIPVGSNHNGEATLKGLAPGDYVVEIDGRSLVAAVDRFASSAPVRKSGGSSSKRSSRERAGREDAAHGGEGAGGDAQGGITLGTNSTIGVDPAGTITITVTAHEPNPTGTYPDAGRRISSSETPYRREEALKGLRIAFKIAENESPRTQDRIAVIMTISYTGLE